MIATSPESNAEVPGAHILNELTTALSDDKQRREAPGLLRALNRVLLRAVTSARQERVQPLMQGLQFAARRLSWEVRGQSVDTDTRYLLGRVDAMIDLASVSLDQSLSTEVIQHARRKHARDVLEYLMKHGNTQAKDLAEAVGVEQNHLSNILRWMEAVELVRRAKVGPRTWVSMGPKGEATLAAVTAMLPPGEPESVPAAAAGSQDGLSQQEGPSTLKDMEARLEHCMREMETRLEQRLVGIESNVEEIRWSMRYVPSHIPKPSSKRESFQVKQISVAA